MATAVLASCARAAREATSAVGFYLYGILGILPSDCPVPLRIVLPFPMYLGAEAFKRIASLSHPDQDAHAMRRRSEGLAY